MKLYVNNLMVEPDGAATIVHVAATQFIESLVRRLCFSLLRRLCFSLLRRLCFSLLRRLCFSLLRRLCFFFCAVRHAPAAFVHVAAAAFIQ